MTPGVDILKTNPTKKKKVKKGKTKTKISKKKYLRIKCPICFNNLGKESISSTICGHVFCTNCLLTAIRVRAVCPTCRRSLKGNKAHHLLYLDEDSEELASP
ncbi:unnamed protein product [Danaus chrysippus]|uniref:(African queen) hypothetical protein n=1 Tax=Danaus chrysippus TaxID=151541 RepID=A0A8J2RAY8_9NEOP|nr:unnamed protein product [Danaus chrysippus]